MTNLKLSYISASTTHVRFDAATMHTQPEVAAQHRMVDDGTGEVEVKIKCSEVSHSVSVHSRTSTRKQEKFLIERPWQTIAVRNTGRPRKSETFTGSWPNYFT